MFQIRLFFLYFPLFLLRNIYTQAYGQSPAGMVKEIVETVKNGDGDSWVNRHLDKYGYDELDRRIDYSNYEWNISSAEWVINYEEKNKFNHNNEKTNSNQRYYNLETGQIISDRETTYENNLPVLEIYNVNDPKNSFYYTTTDTYLYNDIGQILKWTNEVYSPKDKITDKRIESNAYDYNGCRTGSKIESISNHNGVRDYSGDSTGNIVDSKCRILHTNLFQIYSPNFPRYFIRSITNDIVYDTSGFPVKNTSYNNFSLTPVNQGEIISTITYVNNASGAPLIMTEIGKYNISRTFMEYDTQGRETMTERQQYDSLENQWRTFFKLIMNYNEHNDLIYYYMLDGYNAANGGFDNSGDATWIYSSGNFLEKIIQHNRSYQWQTDTYADDTYITEYSDRCDGNPEYGEYREQIGADGSEILKKKYVYRYFDLAYCETAQDEANNISIFPNPAKRYINIFAGNTLGASEIQILSMNGIVQVSKKLTLTNYFSMNLEGLSPGIYIIRINNGIINYNSKIIISN